MPPEPSAATLAPTTRVGPVHLTVADLDRSIGFYQNALGLRLRRHDDGVAALGAGDEDLVVLTEEPGARPAGRHPGLFHLALLHPSREELARAVGRLTATRTLIQGASDHGVSEAIYLADPDRNGIELSADRPRDRWPPPGLGDRVGMFTRPLDVEGLARLVDGEPPRDVHEGLTMGHVHLQVAHLDPAIRFYRDVVGLDLMATSPGAGFLAAGDYHHHLGVNTWRSEGAPPAPEGTVGLRHWTLLLAGGDELERARDRIRAAGAPYEEADGGLLVRDPSGIAALLTTTQR
jgi:catechol 2,3-dioxygenase